MRLLFWSIALLGGVGAGAVVPVGTPVRGAVAETTGGSEGQPVGEAGLPQSGGPEIFLPAASVLIVGAYILMYALRRRQRRA